MLQRPEISTPRPAEGASEATDEARASVAGWNGAVGRVLAYSRAKPTARFVLVAIAQHADTLGRARPSIDRLAALTGHDERTVRRAVAELEALGELLVERRHRHAHRYMVVVAAPVDEEPDEPEDCGYPPPFGGQSARLERAERPVRAGRAPAQHTKNTPGNTGALTTDDGWTHLPGTGWVRP